MTTKNIEEGGVYIPESEKERKALEELIEKGLVKYEDGGYCLTTKGILLCMKKFGRREAK